MPAEYVRTARNPASTWSRRRRSISPEPKRRRIRTAIPLQMRLRNGVSAWWLSVICRHSNQKLAGNKPGGFRGLGVVEEGRGVACFGDEAAVHEHDIAGEASRLAEVVGRHHHLDAAR